MILWFFLFSLMSLTLSILYFVFKRKGFWFNHLIPLLIFFHLITFVLSVYNIILFIKKDPNDILSGFGEYFLYMLFYNISIAIFGISLAYHLSNFLNKSEIEADLHFPRVFSKCNSKIRMGKIGGFLGFKTSFYASIKDLEKHMFICGSTGTGKSNFMQYFLINFKKKYQVPFFLVEFKGEYHFLQNYIEDLLILWPGENFSVNIFNPEGTNPFIHAERIFDILKSGKFFEEYSEFSPQMEKVLIEILTKTCKNSKYQSWEGFKQCSKKYLEKNKNEIPMLKQTLIGVNNRIRRYSEGPLKALFKSNNYMSVTQIFNYDIILDLSSIIRLGGEKEDALFFLNLILKYLWDMNLTKGATRYNGINHITVIEDAQYFAPQGLHNKSKLTTYLEDIALLQRGTGECLVTLATRPDISKEILANNGIVMTFRNHIEKEIMCDLLNLNIEKKSLLSTLNEGECIIRVNSIKQPFLMKIPLLKRELITMKEISEKNKRITTKINETTDIDDAKIESYMGKIKKDETNLVDNSKYQKFYDLIKDLYENQEREKFLESKEHT
jgi:hypothetical protein